MSGAGTAAGGHFPSRNSWRPAKKTVVAGAAEVPARRLLRVGREA